MTISLRIDRENVKRLCVVCGELVDRNAPAVYCSNCTHVQREQYLKKHREYQQRPEVNARYKETARKHREEKKLLVYAYSGEEYRVGVKK